jgi:hypothetical protein
MWKTAQLEQTIMQTVCVVDSNKFHHEKNFRFSVTFHLFDYVTCRTNSQHNTFSSNYRAIALLGAVY